MSRVTAREALRLARIFRTRLATARARTNQRQMTKGSPVSSDNMEPPTLLCDIRLAKQRRAHAVLMPGHLDYRYYVDMVEAIAFTVDSGHDTFLVETDFGKATITVERLVRHHPDR